MSSTPSEAFDQKLPTWFSKLFGLSGQFDEMNHINFDWFAPQNAFRQTLEEVRELCMEAGLEIERERI